MGQHLLAQHVLGGINLPRPEEGGGGGGGGGGDVRATPSIPVHVCNIICVVKPNKIYTFNGPFAF